MKSRVESEDKTTRRTVAMSRGNRHSKQQRSALRRSGRNVAAKDWWLSEASLCLMLAILTLALYGQVVGHDFMRLDDDSYITQNPHVRAGLSWDTVKWSFTSTEQSNWHPVTWLSHSLDCQLFGLGAGAHHIVSVLIHLLNVVLLFLLLHRATGALGRSFMVAALFAWHPFNVESVAWAAERKNVLSTLFLLLTLGAYGWYVKKSNWQRYTVVAALFALGLAAKPMLVTLPFVLLLLDFWPLQRLYGWRPALPQVPLWRLLLEKVPLLALSALSCAVTIVAQRRAIGSTENLPLTMRLANALYSYVLYIWKTFWPFGFAVYYPYPFDPELRHHPGLAASALAVLAALVLVGVTFVAWRQRRTRPYLATGWLWYVGTLVPVIGIVQVGMQAMADRYAYVPLIGLFVIVAWGSGDLAERIGVSGAWRQAAAGTALVVLWLVTFQQIGFWKNNYDVWAHTLEVTQDNFVADDNMGMELMKAGRPESIRYFQDAARLQAKDPMSHGAIAAFLQDNGHLKEAIPEYEVVTDNPPNLNFLAFAHANLGIIYTELGDSGKAQTEFRQALATDRLAVDDAINDLRQKVSAQPADEGYLRLGLLLEQTGRIPEARAACEQALALKPDRTEAVKCLNRLSVTGK
jgi:hypothetical protein